MRKHVLLALGALSLAFTPLAAALPAGTDINQLTSGLNDFVTTADKSLPFAASAGVDWSNAYIGQLIDTDFPFVHFGVGASVGLTTIPDKALSGLLTTFGKTPPSVMGIPYMVINGRVGGFFLPFDIGFKVGFLPDSLTSMVQNFNFTYKNFGLDFRYNLMKSDFALPDISVGVGFNYLDATAGTTLGNTQTFSDGSGHVLMVAAPVASLEMKATEFELKAQVSKTLFYLLTPYVGSTLYYGTGSASAGVNASVTDSLGNVGYWNKYGVDTTSTGLKLSKDQGVFGLKVYGGTSVNITVVKVDLQAMYNVLSGEFGGGLGVRIQL